MSAEEGPDDFDVNALIASIDREYRSGGTFGPVTEQQLPVDKPDSTTESLAKGLMKECINSILPSTGLKQLKELYIDIRAIATYFRNNFEKWQLTPRKALVADAAKGVTLKGLADFAGDQFDKFSREAGKAVPNSEIHKDIQSLADLWGWRQQVIQEAADQAKQ